MIVYTYGKCSTCKDAIGFLRKRDISFTEKEITEVTPSIPELRRMLGYYAGNLKKLFNKSGLLYKEMGLKEKLEDLNLDEALAMLNHHGMLIKRPFLLGKDFGLVGFKEAEWSNKI